MKLIIPMSGQGSRFQAAGYTVPKPLIKVEGKPIIEHVLDMFKGVDDVIFICNEEHLKTTPMEIILRSLRSEATILPIAPHKLGPVYAVSQAYDLIKDNEDVIISYCDFTQAWDFEAFKRNIEIQKPAGAVPAYTGFHPHLLKRNLYAGIVADENGRMLQIKEKHCFTEKPEDSYHSSGIYYFGSGAILKHYFDALVNSGETLNGEYYISMVYPQMLKDSQEVLVPEVTKFMQWGTPEDLEEYETWSRLIHLELGLQKYHTDIPETREEFVKIPYPKNSPEFEKSYQYWSNHFNQLHI